ncbi:prorelaxin H1 [Thalassophryne amazonica]|uniref:prorelaxin H1 n=1 Tax=Thalassophryne amazonica TaxID=390379 RepID=UPI001470FA52|nr:prorelaxin H1 [Thalassophryne amazonica]
MLCRLTLTVTVVCVAGICSHVQAGDLSGLIIGRDYGVKLCGREFIRAVIFTCGGSRWKRATLWDSDPLKWISVTADNQQTWQRGEVLTNERSFRRVSSLYSLLELLPSYWASGAERRSQSYRSGQPTAEGDTEENLGADWVLPRKRRNFSLGVAGMCCHQGCTKTDIGRLC